MKWVHNYLTGRSEYTRVNNKPSSAIPNNRGVLQGAVLSPFFFTLHTSDLYSESLASFLKYADDVVIGHPRKDSQGIFTTNNALKYVLYWSGDYGLKLDPSKCVQRMFTLKGNAATDLDFKANINGNTLTEVESGTYHGVTLSKIMQNGPPMLRTSLESAYVSPFCKETS